MPARRLATILPAMTLAEAIETTRIHRVAGLTNARIASVTTRPCRAAPLTIADVGLIGGSHVPMPGEVWLAYDSIRMRVGQAHGCILREDVTCVWRRRHIEGC